MEEQDIPTCLSIYRANEEHFPPGHFEYFEKSLRNGGFVTLIATRNDQPVGFCGLCHETTKTGRIALLCYGIVTPTHYRSGIGTAQLLTRIALITPVSDLTYATMLAVPNSVPFYRRFGFDFSRDATAEDGRVYPFGMLKISQRFIEDCRTTLARRNITYPDVRDKIPERVHHLAKH